jgi:RNA polymerase sigma-70 factor (ECF subfamily)
VSEEREDVLVKDAQAGSKAAFVSLLRLHQGRVRAFLVRYVRDKDVREDLAQETFLAAFRDLGAYKGDAPFGIWVLTIARHRALDYLRREQVQRAGEPRVFAAAVARWKADQAENDQASVGLYDHEVSALRACAGRLPQTSTKLLQEHYFRGESLENIAREMGRTEGAIKMALFRIREAIRECMERRLVAAGAGHE